MKKLMTRLAIAAIGTGMFAAAASAGGEGSIGKAAPKIKYSGTVSTQQAYPYYQLWSNEPSAPCASGCDMYNLKVTDAGSVTLKFELGSTGTTGNGFVGVRVKRTATTPTRPASRRPSRP